LVDPAQANREQAAFGVFGAVYLAPQPHAINPNPAADDPPASQHQRQHQAINPFSPIQPGLFEVKALTFQIPKGFINGMITNDKFCLTRWGALELSWWRRPLRLRNAAN
jgi:hypothetical protein